MRDQVTYAFAKHNGAMVRELAEDSAHLAVRQGVDPFTLLEVRRAIGRPFTIETIEAAAFDRLLEEVFSQSALDEDDVEAAVASRSGLEGLIDEIPQTADLLDGENDAPVIRLINGLIHEAVKQRASDVHIDPFEKQLSIRYRVDGELIEVLTPPRKIASPIVSRIKVMARLDIAEKRLPQDGRISLSVGGRSIDVRVATLPTRYGERVVMRLLDNNDAKLSLSDLGMDADTFARFADILAQPNGVILVTGPVGSGKTTTLYSALSHLNSGRVNIMTLEDPVEYGLHGISQTQMDSKIGLTFAATLRSILRQDPNIVMVGEIRDRETAEVSFEFSSTGRLALSTLHTNSSAAAITRLRDMGVESYLLASTLRAVMAQRLIRKLCSACRVPHVFSKEELQEQGFDVSEDLEGFNANPDGCFSCSHSGFGGRLAIYELLTMTPALRELLQTNAPETAIEASAFARHDKLLDNAWRYLKAGETSLGEVLRVVRKEAGHGGV